MRFAFVCIFAPTLFLLPLAGQANPDGPADNKTESVRPVPPAGIPIPEDRRRELDAALERLGKDIADLSSSKDKFIVEYLPDVEIFHRAVLEWHRQMRGDARIKNSDELTPEDIQNFNLILWGDPASNPTIAKVLNQLPMKWSNESLTIGGRTTDAKSHMPIMIYPNPLAPERYLVLNSGFTYREYDYLNNARQVPKLPDWSVVDISTPPDSRSPGRIVDTDFFDEAWQLKPQRPNIVLIFADDLGYGDLGCFGQQRWKTPHLDSIAANGIRFTDFHSSQPVCSASRASLLTGCYANRIGIHGALFPASNHGIHDDEVLIPELLKPFGYRNCMVGKWHLGHHQKFLPRQHGFDRYLGLPYSNDMWPHGTVVKKTTFPPLPLFQDNEIIDADVDAADQADLTRRYTDLAVEFIRESQSEPFFLYYAHTFPHVPLFASEAFAGRSSAGIYGDVIEEFDHSVGRILNELDARGLTQNTLVIFTSDNGPWLTYGDHAGTAGPLREGKGTVYEGGVRVPMVAQWPGKIPAGSVQTETAMTIDILPTLARIVGAPLPNHPIDGLDILDLMTAKPQAKCPHDVFYHYYRNGELQAIRSGPWKLILPHSANCIDPNAIGSGGKPGTLVTRKIEQPELYNLDVDLGETTDVATKEPEIMAKLMVYVEQARQELGDSIHGIAGRGVRAPGM